MRVFRGVKPDAVTDHKCTAKPIDTKQCKYCKFKDECEFYNEEQEND